MLDSCAQFGVHWSNPTPSSPMFRTSLVVVALFLILLPLSALQAQGTAQQSVSLAVMAVTKIAVSGNPGSLVLSNAVAGSPEMSAEDRSTTYSVTTNLDNMKIVASIDNPMPAGTRLMVNMESVRGLSSGLVDLSSATTPVDVVTGLSRGSESARQIAYVFSADAAVGAVPSQSRTITLTLTN